MRQPGDLEVLRTNVAEEARTRGFASLAFASFAFVRTIIRLANSGSILGSTYQKRQLQVQRWICSGGALLEKIDLYAEPFPLVA